MKYLTLSIPGYNNITAPGGIPTTGGNNIINVGLSIFLIFITIISFFYLIYGGFRWIISGGDKEKIAIARLTITYAIGGLLLSFFSYAILNFLSSILGINLLSFTL